jgi:chromosome segregation ATPase
MLEGSDRLILDEEFLTLYNDADRMLAYDAGNDGIGTTLLEYGQERRLFEMNGILYQHLKERVDYWKSVEVGVCSEQALLASLIKLRKQAKFQAQNEEYREKIATLESKLDATINHLEEERQTAQNIEALLQQERSALNESLVQERLEHCQIKKDLVNLSELMQNELVTLNESLIQERDAMRQCQLGLDETLAQLAIFKDELQHKNGKIQELEEQLALCDQQNSVLLLEIESCNQQNSRLLLELETCNQLNSKLSLEIESCNQQNSKKSMELVCTEQQLQSQKESYQALLAETKRQQAMDRLNQNGLVIQHSEQVSDLQTTLAELRNDLDLAKHRDQSNLDKVHNLMLAIKSKDDIISQLRSDLQELSADPNLLGIPNYGFPASLASL